MGIQALFTLPLKPPVETIFTLVLELSLGCRLKLPVWLVEDPTLETEAAALAVAGELVLLGAVVVAKDGKVLGGAVAAVVVVVAVDIERKAAGSIRTRTIKRRCRPGQCFIGCASLSAWRSEADSVDWHLHLHCHQHARHHFCDMDYHIFSPLMRTDWP
jgi:hypothetical protein